LETTLETKNKAKWPTVGDLKNEKFWLVLGLISIAALIFIYHDIILWWWVAWWMDESYYSHGVLIPIISGFIIWFNWSRIRKIVIEPTAWGLAILLPAILVEFITYRSTIPSIAGMTLPIALIGISMFLIGKQGTKELLFPFIFLYFMCVPPTQILAKISFQIQLLSTIIATKCINLLGWILDFEATRYGTQINIMPSNTKVIVGAPCSGFRMLIALLAFTTFFAYMKKGPLWGRLSLIILVFPLSLLANSIRVMLIALVGHYMGDDAMHTFHDWSGYIVLAITFAILILLAKVVKCRDFKSMPSSSQQ
jgi:exosortase